MWYYTGNSKLMVMRLPVDGIAQTGLRKERTRQMRVRSEWMKAVMLAMVLGIAGMASAQVQVTVPDVVGLTQAAATTAIEGANLTVGTVTQVCSDTVPAGNVISQNPVGGASVAPGSTVDFVVSTGPCVTVPNVVGLTQAVATTAIGGANLTVGTVTRVCSDTVPAGNVISQNPVRGASVAPGSTVDFVVSTGPCPVTVPDVVGLAQAAAEAAITAANLYVGTVTQVCSDTVPAGSVISQNPPAGVIMSSGGTVALEISSGPCPAQTVAVPNVAGMEQGQAETEINGAGLTVASSPLQVCSDTVPAGSVISQNPLAGVVMSNGGAVALVISSGPCPAQTVAVPNVAGLEQGQAETEIDGAGLTVASSPLQVCSDTVAAGKVISQFPAAGTQVTPGSAVLLVISTGSCGTGGIQVVTVPSLVGQSQANAQAVLSAASLNLGQVSTRCSDTVPAGNVVSQYPASGTSVPEGTPVALVVSSGSCVPSGPVTVPSLVGQPESVAQQLLADNGLSAGSQLYVFSTSKNPNTVLRQTPAAGQSVARGTAVNLVISRGLNLDPPSNRDIMKQLYDRLSELDKNGDGLSLEEAVAVEGLPGLPIEVFELVDLNGDGVITEAEFVEYLGIGGCFGCVKRLFVKDLVISAGGDLLLAGLGLALLAATATRRRL